MDHYRLYYGIQVPNIVLGCTFESGPIVIQCLSVPGDQEDKVLLSLFGLSVRDPFAIFGMTLCVCHLRGRSSPPLSCAIRFF